MSNSDTQQPEINNQEPVLEAAEALVTATPEVTKDAPETKEAAKGDPVLDKKVEAPAFVPDFKYKFNGQEKEIEDFWKPLVKDPDTLKKVRDAIERAEATEMHRETAKTHEAKIKEWEPMVQDVQRLQSMFEAAKGPGDFRNILEELGFTKDHLKDVVREYLKEEALPAEQQKILESQKAMALEKRQLMSQNEEITTQYNSVLRDITSQQIDLELGKAENAQLVKAYEDVNGKGTFRQLLLERGSYYVSTEGRHVPPTEVMGRLAKEFAPFISRATAEAVPQAAAQPAVRTQPKAMPQVGSGGGSPTKPSVMSLADLKARYEQLTQQQE